MIECNCRTFRKQLQKNVVTHYSVIVRNSNCDEQLPKQTTAQLLTICWLSLCQPSAKETANSQPAGFGHNTDEQSVDCW